MLEKRWTTEKAHLSGHLIIILNLNILAELTYQKYMELACIPLSEPAYHHRISV